VTARLDVGGDAAEPAAVEALSPNELLAVFGMVVIDDHDAVVVSRLDEDDQATEVVYVNDTYTRLAGFKLNEVYGGPLGAVVGTETDRVALQALVAEFTRAGISEEELTLHGRDGSPFRVRIRLQAVPSPEHGTLMVARCRDITEQRARNHWFQALIDNVSDIIVVLDAEGRFRYVSPATRTILGYEPADVLGHPVTDFLELDHHIDFDEVFTAVVETPGVHRRFGLNLRAADGQVHLLETTVTNRLSDPAVRGLVAAGRDETERHRGLRERQQREAWFQALLSRGFDLILILDDEGTVTYASPSVREMFDTDQASLLGANLAEVVHPDDVGALRAVLGHRGRRSRSARLRVLHGRLGWRHLDIHATDLRDEAAVRGVVVNAHDITDQVAVELLLAEQTEILEAVARGAPLDVTLDRAWAVLERTVAGAVVSVGLVEEGGMLRHPPRASVPKAVTDALNRTPASSPLGGAMRAAHESPVVIDVIADPVTEPVRSTLLDEGFGGLWLRSIRAPGDERLLGTITVLLERPADPSTAARESVDRIAHLTSIAIDRRAVDDRLRHQALHDSLTGLPNRQQLLNRVSGMLAAAGEGVLDSALLFVDLDQFKVVNDSLGHQAGDEVLDQLADRLVGAIRPQDFVARFGGDEFVVVCERVGGEEGAVAIAERLARTLEEPFAAAGSRVVLSSSVGIELVTDTSVAADDLIRNADSAMYRAKEMGRDNWVVFDEELHERLVRRLQLEQELRTAVTSGHITVRYQPQIRLADGWVVGVEALARWDRPGRGEVPPEEFVPVAEESGLIVALGRQVLEEACREAAVWRQQPGLADLGVTVNLAARQLTDDGLLDLVDGVLRENELPPDALCLEVTESALVGDLERATIAVQQLSDRGVKVAIDDFGTGYATLEHVRRFWMANQLKIDQSFVAGLAGGGPQDDAIVSATVVLAHTMGMTAVAEGVETLVQRDRLVALGCELGQRFLFSPALPADELRALLADRRITPREVAGR